MNQVEVKKDQIYFDGKPTYVFGRLSGKLVNYIARNRVDLVMRWIEWNQKLGFNLLRVFGEEEQPGGIYVRKPGFRNVWPIAQLRRGVRPRDVTERNRRVLKELYRISHETGMAFEYVIDCTLKNVDGVSSGMIGHCISRTLDACRPIARLYPLAKIIFNFHNEWNDSVALINRDERLGAGELAQQAGRCRRWVQIGPDGEKETVIQFESPGPTWLPEQYPDAVIMVDERGGDISYPCGDGPKEFPIAAIHPEGLIVNLNRFKRYKAPIYISQTEPVEEFELERYIKTMEWCRKWHAHFVVCDHKGALMDVTMPETELEKHLLGFEPPPPPPPEPEPEKKWWEVLLDILKGLLK